jgi:hypothetical protein
VEGLSNATTMKYTKTTCEIRIRLDSRRSEGIKNNYCRAYNDEEVGYRSGEKRQIGQIERVLVRLIQRTAEITVCTEPQKKKGACVYETGFARIFSMLPHENIVKETSRNDSEIEYWCGGIKEMA